MPAFAPVRRVSSTVHMPVDGRYFGREKLLMAGAHGACLRYASHHPPSACVAEAEKRIGISVSCWDGALVGWLWIKHPLFRNVCVSTMLCGCMGISATIRKPNVCMSFKVAMSCREGLRTLAF